MELKLRHAWKQRLKMILLIVPYGIETLSVLMSNSGRTPFNRTLWN